MKPEKKEKIKEILLKKVKEEMPEYPNGNPQKIFALLPDLYRELEEANELPKIQGFPEFEEAAIHGFNMVAQRSRMYQNGFF